MSMPTQYRNPPCRAQRGMGIVELMVGLLIGLIMAVALAWFYLGSRTLSRASDDVSRLQESGRGALEIIGMAIRQSGYRSNVNAAFSGTALGGFDGANNAPDTITIQYDAQEGGEIDCTGTPVPACGPAVAPAACRVTYQFTISSASNASALMCVGAVGAPVAVVDNIEDMQFSYGIDANKDGSIELYKSLPSSAAEWAGVVAVRISLLARGPSTNVAANNTQTLTFNGAPITKQDGYIRQAYGGTFAVRRQAF